MSVNLPIEVVRDRRLTLEQHRVLTALYSFKPKDSDTVFPRRQKIAELTGMHPANISTATSALERLGWLTKDGKGGHSKATRYTLTIPATVAEQETVAHSATVAEQATGRVAESATGLRVADSATRKEQKSEQRKRTGTADVFNATGWLIERGVSDSHAKDWLAVRKIKRAANTETAFARVMNQATLAGMSLDRVVQIMVEKSWQSFDAEWIGGKQTPSQLLTVQQSSAVGETRTRGGRVEVFNENMGWVPA